MEIIMKKRQIVIYVIFSILLSISTMYGQQNERRDQRDKPEILMDIAGVKSGDPQGLVNYPEKSMIMNTDNWLTLVLPEKYSER
jgi:hypothetical protein